MRLGSFPFRIQKSFLLFLISNLFMKIRLELEEERGMDAWDRSKTPLLRLGSIWRLQGRKTRALLLLSATATIQR